MKPTVTSEGRDKAVATHPAFATISVTRINGSKNLFDSNVVSDGYIALKITGAKQYSDAYSSRVHGGLDSYIEVVMSEAQYVGMVTRMNMGSGTPCTLNYLRNPATGLCEKVPNIDAFESSADKLLRVANDIADEREMVANEHIKTLQDAIALLPKKHQVEALRAIEGLTTTAARNAQFGREILVETAEKLVVEAKVEVNAAVQGIVTSLGIRSLNDLSDAKASLTSDNQSITLDPQ